METSIKEITEEVAIYFEVGKVVKDLLKNDTYEIKQINKEGLLLEHKPSFRAEPKNDLLIEYDELALAFSKNRFHIDGFSILTEGGSKPDIERLKRAIKDTRDKIEIEKRTLETKMHQETHQTMTLKRKTKRLVRQVRSEEEMKRNAELLRLKKEKDNKIAHEKKIRILNIKNKNQQQRFRIFHIQD